MVMKDIVCTHGKCVTGFKEEFETESPRAVLPQILEVYNPKVKKTFTAISAGFLGVSKRTAALIGTRGAISFKPTSQYPKGVDFGWEVPLFVGSNKVLVSANYTGTVNGFSDKVLDDGKLNVEDTSSKNHIVEAHMNSKGGSQGFAFVIIN